MSLLKHYGQGDFVIFERCVADYLAYMLSLSDLGRDEDALRVVHSSLDMVKDAIRFLDVIVFLQAGDAGGAVISDSEDPALRSAVDTRLVGILTDDDFGLFGCGGPFGLEVTGTTAQRLQTLEAALRIHPTGREGR